MFPLGDEGEYFRFEDVATDDAIVEVVCRVEGIAVVYGIASTVEQGLYRLTVECEMARRGFHVEQDVFQFAPTVFPLLDRHWMRRVDTTSEARGKLGGGKGAVFDERKVYTDIVAFATSILIVRPAEGLGLFDLAVDGLYRRGAVDGEVCGAKDVLKTKLIHVAEVGRGELFHIILQSFGAGVWVNDL